MTPGTSARQGGVILLVGTRKGSFIISSGPARPKGDVSGIHSPGSDVFHMAYDHRNGGRILSATNSMIWGRSWNILTTGAAPGLSLRNNPGLLMTMTRQ